MMDFLRRLAPPRENDATRAIAVLPSRFASERPLRTTAVEVQPDPPIDDEAFLALDTQTTPESISVSPTQPSTNSRTQRARAELAGLDREPALSDREASASFVRRSAPLDVSTMGTDAGVVREPRDADSERTRRIETSPHDLAPAQVAELAAHDMTPRALLHMAKPLSSAALTQRAHESQERSEVIHVSIGRIEVIARSSPVPAAPRASKPRTGTVTLADYLRGGNGSHR